MSDTAGEQPGAIQQLVENYIKLRDAKADVVAKAKEKTQRIDAAMAKIEGTLLRHCDSMGIDSIKTPMGTAYKSSKSSATVADWDVVLQFIMENSLWSMLERRVSKDFVTQYKAESGELPPGVNWSEITTINVRRPQA